jgi:RTX calcium-binding nonapeptide repeat (4 copies)
MMHLSRLRICWSGGILLGLLITVALSLWLATPTSAQVTVTCNGVPATIVGVAPGPITGTAGNDVIVGTTGVDQIAGLGGDDIICAGPGNDQVSGGDGNDTLVWTPAMAAMWSKVRLAATRSRSTARTPTRTSTCRPMAHGYASSAMWQM